MTFRPTRVTGFSLRSVSEPVQLPGDIAGQLSRIEAMPRFTFTVPPVIVTGRARVAIGRGVMPGPGFTTGPGVTAGGGVTSGGGGVTTGGGGVTTDTPLTASNPSRTSSPTSEIA